MFGPGVGKKIEEITPEYLGTLKKHVWKGNVRELRNVIERSMIIADGAVLTVSDLPFDIQQSVWKVKAEKDTLNSTWPRWKKHIYGKYCNIPEETRPRLPV